MISAGGTSTLTRPVGRMRIPSSRCCRKWYPLPSCAAASPPAAICQSRRDCVTIYTGLHLTKDSVPEPSVVPGGRKGRERFQRRHRWKQPSWLASGGDAFAFVAKRDAFTGRSDGERDADVWYAKNVALVEGAKSYPELIAQDHHHDRSPDVCCRNWRHGTVAELGLDTHHGRAPPFF